MCNASLSRLPIALVCLLATGVVCCGHGLLYAQPPRPELPEPDFANARYGPHERNVLDLWQAASDKPTPLVIYIHGGGFRNGSKETVGAGAIEQFRRAGISVAAINYRLTDVAPFPAAHHDSARAVQFLRSKAKEWNLDPKRFGTTGGSAGGGISLWLAFHDDLADPKSDDPVARESTRLTCVAVSAAQSSYDPRFARSIGLPRLEQHSFFLPFYGITRDEIDSPKAHKLYDEAAAITHLTKDDAPVLAVYSGADEPITDATSMNVIVHHPKFGIALKERMDKLGIECIVSYRDQADRPNASPLQFFQKHFGMNEK
jgi:acetyl esterase/lipase